MTQTSKVSFDTQATDFDQRAGLPAGAGRRVAAAVVRLAPAPSGVLLDLGAGTGQIGALVKDVDGLYEADPKIDSSASLIREISVSELRARCLPTLPFDEILLDLMERARLVDRMQIINGLKPELPAPALDGEHVGTIVYAE